MSVVCLCIRSGVDTETSCPNIGFYCSTGSGATQTNDREYSGRTDPSRRPTSLSYLCGVIPRLPFYRSEYIEVPRQGLYIVAYRTGRSLSGPTEKRSVSDGSRAMSWIGQSTRPARRLLNRPCQAQCGGALRDATSWGVGCRSGGPRIVVSQPLWLTHSHRAPATRGGVTIKFPAVDIRRDIATH